MEVFLAPDNAFAAMKTLLEGAQHSIRFEGYTLDNTRLGEIIAAKARAGVGVEIMLEGGPPGGVTDQQLWVVQQIAQAGGHVYYLRSNSAAGIQDRYTYQHGKFWVQDGVTALIGSENLNLEAFPDDPKADGTLGRRGVLSGHRCAIGGDRVDCDHGRRYRPAGCAARRLGVGPGPTRPWARRGRVRAILDSGGSFYPVQKPAPLTTQGAFTFQLIHSPEQALRDQDSLLGLINRAGAGDTILVEQLYEQVWVGRGGQQPHSRSEPAAAGLHRRSAPGGAKVRVLLDAFFDNQDLTSPRKQPTDGGDTASAAAQAEGIDLQARRGNPTGLGIHNKMAPAQIGGKGWAIVGSPQPRQVSAKLNREMALLVGSDEVYRYLADVFWDYWNVTP